MKNNLTKRYFKTQVFILITLFLLSCNTSKTFRGGAIGAGAGGTIGGIIGSRSDNTAKGAILGAVIGGAAGAVVGKYMDKQAQELEKDLKDAEVERIGEGIKITFDSGILFGFNSSALTPTAITNINNLAETLKKYSDTEILVQGHTDNKGSQNYNQQLSEKRAEAVSDYLGSAGVSKSRIKVEGYGESKPIADNSTEEGRSQNRRVEVAIYANDELKKAAEKGELGKVNY